MAAASSFHTLPVKNFSTPTSSRRHLPQILPLKFVPNLRGSRGASLRSRAVTDDDEWGRDLADTVAAAVTDLPKPSPNLVTGELKTKLKDLLYGTDRGLKASSETRAEIVELITQLEAKNPTPAPTEALSLLNGKWILA